MRLSKIKLSGFKSFVDPTTIVLPSNLVGVVGPNGCGKSNVIDAIRWVMGETSAKNLRGESMADVIFNGSANRKPVGAASIELFFDNADGAIGGQFASYGEVAVRRTVSRDGTSQYFLNNVRCRRKDITGIFLGTGLGPRSYAIIEQGMISRLIEAKPEDMRAHLEEAAGISKYKERRRETETRIRHTRDNLDRLNDLREEVEAQLKNLQKQARAAERYTELKQEQRQAEAELLVLSLRSVGAEIERENLQLSRQRTELEAAIAAQRKTESDIEQARQQQTLSGDELNATTARHYSVDLEISHLEQAIDHNRATRERQQLDLEEARMQMESISVEIDADEAQLRQVDVSLARLTPGLEEARQVATGAARQLEASQKALADWQETWGTFSRELHETQRITEVEAARIEQMHEQQGQLSHRRESLELERDTISLESIESQVTALARDEAVSAQQEQEVTGRLNSSIARLQQLRQQDETLSSELQQARGQLDASRARLAALETLQQAALGGDHKQAQDWLAANQLAARPRLAQQLKVHDAWKGAVETVLGDFLQAVAVDGVDRLLSRLPELQVALYEDDPLRYASEGAANTLLSFVDNAGPAAELLAHVRTAENLQEAVALRSRLGQGESVITPEGIWLSRTWVRVAGRESETGGVLAREQEIRKLSESLRSLENQVERLAQQRLELRSQIEVEETERQRHQQAQTQVGKEHASIAARLGALRTELDKSRQRSLSLGEDSETLQQQIQMVISAIEESRLRLRAAEDKAAQMEGRMAELRARQQQLQQDVELATAEAEAAREAYHNLTLEVQTQRSSRETATTTLERALNQRRQLTERMESLQAHLARGDAPLAELQQKLQQQLELKQLVDAELRAKHEALEQVNEGLRQLETMRIQQDKAATSVREVVDAQRMRVRELEIRQETVSERFSATGLELEAVQQALPENANAPEWNERLEKIQRSLDRIGTVNLLAIEEFEEQSERAKYLESQHEDLHNALETLEKAIRKIDRETRARFQEVFDSVNSGLKRIFPRLFGGGHAYLTLEGDDLLNAGVTVMAQPPGKRNSSIHLLSGGEKALTAVALVFSIFELNPAPFCLLDEVDAPLDDANVSRFCDIVREMSANVQFLFITHNKVTMELANQLMGVTMAEPGVSRLVSVDIDEAIKLAS